MTFWILPSSGIPIPRSSVIPLSPQDREHEPVNERIAEFNLKIKAKVENTPNFVINAKEKIDIIHNVNMFQSNNPTQETLTTKDLWEGDIDSIPYEPTNEESAMEHLDEHIGQKIQLNKNDSPVLVKIVSRKRDAAGNLTGKKNPDPKLDSRIYNVQYPDGHFERYSTNVLSEALNETMDHDGYDKSYISEICGYRKNMKHAITKENGFVKSHNGRDVPVITTKGWKVNVRWLNGSTN